MVNNADIYVGFDMSMTHTSKKWPWEEGESVLYPIPDMGVPRDPEEFKKLIHWLSVQLVADKLIHIGCIGGHGRTGTVMAALVTHMTGEKDSITYVRNNYCQKAVESSTQVAFLMEHFGVAKAPGFKEHARVTPNSWAMPIPPRAKPTDPALANPLPKGSLVAYPTTHPMCIWSDSMSLVKPLNVL
jgi:hypothetical protein